jgi:hypothetical protein
MNTPINLEHRGLLLPPLLFLAVASLSSTALGALPTKPGIWCDRTSARAVSNDREQRLEMSLRRISGFGSLHFDSDGFLSVGDSENSSGGAEAARDILLKAMSSGDAFLIEDHSGSDSIHFGQITEFALSIDREGRRLDVWLVRLDFDDFRDMKASSEIRASFDEGFVLLHELLHGLGCNDGSKEGELGECEIRLNQARSELGLPLRDQYFGIGTQLGVGLTCVRVKFKTQSRKGVSSKSQSRYLYFLLRRSPESSDVVGSETRVRR